MGRGRHNRKNVAETLTDRIQLWCAGAVLVLALWLTIMDWHEVYGLTVLLLMPPLAALAWLSLHFWFAGRQDDQPFLLGAMILVPLILAVAAHWAFDFLDGRFSEWMLAVVLVAIVLCFFLFVGRMNESPILSRLWMASVVLFFVLCYLDGAIKLLDVSLDTAAPMTHRADVTGKEIIDRWYLHRHFRSDPTYRLRYSARGLDGVEGSMAVSPDDYVAATVGSRLCVRLHPGYLDLRWYEIDRCE